ncbi:hypothetical protein JOC86_004503 [Bacillus pakistanensis]|uniref:RNase H type-1 domain-containing protein n=1 Tax=Rossellomorea pakistanensis TaxID=992288 RepID=A0ABS2NJB7_9BACI|nr:hypothetical protein [Bacillus pakistanensis]MBM7587928.1 hypothetical protein [Bacillus pakistanensis]
MFTAYTDASIQGDRTFLGFTIEFEDSSTVRRRIVMDRRKPHTAEALAIYELSSFLLHYKLCDGVIFIDCKEAKNWIKRRKGKGIPKSLYRSLRAINVGFQIIPRIYNIAHIICNKGSYIPSNSVSSINRNYYKRIENYPNYRVSLSVYLNYRGGTNKRKTIHKYQKSLNEKIWLGELVREKGDARVFAYYDLRIMVNREGIVKVWAVNYVNLNNHQIVMEQKNRLEQLLKGVEK